MGIQRRAVSPPVPILTIATTRPILLPCTMDLEYMRIPVEFNNNRHSYHRPIQIRRPIRILIHLNPSNRRHTNNPNRINPIITSVLILLPMHNHRVVMHPWLHPTIKPTNQCNHHKGKDSSPMDTIPNKIHKCNPTNTIWDLGQVPVPIT